MRRTLTALALVGTLAASAACADKSTPAGAPATSSAAGAPTSEAPSPEADYTADTKKVCAKIDTAMKKSTNAFGGELGKLIAYKQIKNTAAANRAKAGAQRELKALATAIRSTTAAAQDPTVKAAGQESAANIEATAANNAFFDKLKTEKDLDSLESEITAWLVPLGTHCA
jgi:hypothetical protein